MSLIVEVQYIMLSVKNSTLIWLSYETLTCLNFYINKTINWPSLNLKGEDQLNLGHIKVTQLIMIVRSILKKTGTYLKISIFNVHFRSHKSLYLREVCYFRGTLKDVLGVCMKNKIFLSLTRKVILQDMILINKILIFKTIS